MDTVEMLNMGIEHIDQDKNLNERERFWIERMAQAVKKCVDDNQYLDDWKIGKAVFEEFQGELELLDTLIE